MTKAYLVKISLLILLLASLLSLSPLAAAHTRIDVGETNLPQNMVLLIVDGMGSRYICPGSVPQALDGAPINPAEVPILNKIISSGVLIPAVKVPVPKTGVAHSVIITGYLKAEQEMVEYPDATIYDVLEDKEFLSIAIMHKGDFAELRNEQDIILYSESNSIEAPAVDVQVNDNHVPADIISELEYWEQKLPAYLQDTDGIERYIAYAD
jgi:2,3-bisphosphoglycerate-independent phosphoglycerate mutase